MRKFFEQFIGKPVAIECIRFCYRGIVTVVNDDSVVLSDAFIVENTGMPTATQPEQEAPMPCDWLVTYSSIEGVGQLTWAFAGYEKTKKQEVTK